MSKYKGGLWASVGGEIRVYNSSDPGQALGHSPGPPPFIYDQRSLEEVDANYLDWCEVSQQDIDDLVDAANNEIDTPPVDSIVVIDDSFGRKQA